MRNHTAGALAGLTLLLLALTPVGEAAAQAMDFDFDLTVPTHDSPDVDGERLYNTDVRFNFGFGIHSRDFRRDERRHRWGLVFNRQSVHTHSVEPSEFWSSYINFSIQASYERLLWSQPRFDVVGGLATGPAIVSRTGHPTESCNTAFCNFPDGSWVVTPSLRVMVPVFDAVKFTAGVRAFLYTADKASIFPFESGPVLTVGLEVS